MAHNALSSKMQSAFASMISFDFKFSLDKYGDRVSKITERLNDLHVTHSSVLITLAEHWIREVYEIRKCRLKDRAERW